MKTLATLDCKQELHTKTQTPSAYYCGCVLLGVTESHCVLLGVFLLAAVSKVKFSSELSISTTKQIKHKFSH